VGLSANEPHFYQLPKFGRFQGGHPACRRLESRVRQRPGLFGQTRLARRFVLALITPDYFGAVQGENRRIDRADDPVCEELIAAWDASAQIIPLLSESVKMSPAGSLPERLQPITSCHALRLRSEDWNNDLLRLIEDVAASGVKVQDKDWRLTFGGAPEVRAGRWVAVAGTAFLIALGLEAVLMSEKSSGANDYFGAAVVGLMPLAAALYAARTLKGGARKLRYAAMVLFEVRQRALRVTLRIRPCNPTQRLRNCRRTLESFCRGGERRRIMCDTRLRTDRTAACARARVPWRVA
jgi:hypothetical protein